MDITKEVTRTQEIQNLVSTLELNQEINNSQTNFLNNILEKALNFGVNMGIKAITPDFVEDQVIEIKDNIIENGFEKTVSSLVNQVQDFGKNVMGLFNGNFNNSKELEQATKNVELYNMVEQLVNKGIDRAIKSKKINKDLGNFLKDTNSVIVENFSKDLNKSILKENKNFEKLDQYNKDWENAWLDRDIEKMEKALENINKMLEKLTKYKDPIIKADRLNELHNHIVKSGNFDYQEGMVY